MPENTNNSVSATDEMASILNGVNVGANYGLMIEVLWTAMHYLKSNPDMSIKDAIEDGLNEWIK